MLIEAPPPAEAKIVHYAPADHYIGDVHPIFVKGRCYLFYLKSETPTRYRSAVAVSDDLIHWQQHDLTHKRPHLKVHECFVVAPFYDHVGGVYRSFYHLFSSVSDNLLSWDRAEGYELPRLETEYVVQRDPCVTWDPESKTWYCVMTCRQHVATPAGNHAIGLFRSSDLRNWRHVGATVSGLQGAPECPQLFRIGTRWVLLAAVQSVGVGGFGYWMSDSPEGPWSERRVLDGTHFCAPQVAWDGKRWLAFAWVPLHVTPQQYWGGHLALPREIGIGRRGGLVSRLPEDVGKRLRGPLLHEMKFSSHSEIAKKDAVLPATLTQAGGDLEVRWQATLGSSPLQVEFVRPDESRFAIVLEPVAGQLRARESDGVNDLTATPWSEDERFGGLLDTRVEGNDDCSAIASSNTAYLRVIFSSTIVESFANETGSLVTRLTRSVSGSEIRVRTDIPLDIKLFRLGSCQSWQAVTTDSVH